MCYQLAELYSACQCLYYLHAADRCPAYGQPGHAIQKRTLYVGYACSLHVDRALPGLEEAAKHVANKQTFNTITKKNREKFHQDIGSKKRTTGANPQNGSRPDPRTLGRRSSGRLRSRPPASDGTTTKGNKSAGSFESQDHAGKSGGEESHNKSFIADVFSEIGCTEQSSQTSAGTLPAPDALEQLVNSFIYEQHLQFLWPQVVLRADNMDEARAQLGRLILRFSVDLQSLAQSSSDKGPGCGSMSSKVDAAKFVQQNCHLVARQICKHYWLQEKADSEGEKQNFGKKTEHPQSDHGAREPTKVSNLDEEQAIANDGDAGKLANDAPGTIQLTELKDFIFLSEPFYSFRDNLQAHVERTAILPLGMRLEDTIRRFLANLALLFTAAPVPKGMKRALLISHCQSCGAKLYDDYREKREGALDNLRELLGTCGIKVASPGDIESSNIPRAQPSHSASTIPLTILGQRSPDLRLPEQWRHKDVTTPGSCRANGHANGADHHNYILACLPSGPWVSNLRQAEVCTINSDQDFFSLLRFLHKDNRRQRWWSWLRRVTAIHFIKLELFHYYIVDVRSTPSLPPTEQRAQYFYDPMPADLMPPIGPNVLLTASHLRLGLRPMDIYKEVVNRKTIPTSVDPAARFQYFAERLTASAITQTYHYMIEGGLEYSLLTTGETIVFLTIDWDDPGTLYYHLAEPGPEAVAHSDQLHLCTAVGQYLAFTLLVLETRGEHGQEERQRATQTLHTWAEDFETTVRSVPDSERTASSPRPHVPHYVKSNLALFHSTMGHNHVF
ncbi:hypothetical protein S40288_09976 [Stachybotrys chartarum IBT 40288]|nr:hypothetical protein S40288_09976 [Stachybotrys chartarum IBT 40288]